jgi:hypothetical protein
MEFNSSSGWLKVQDIKMHDRKLTNNISGAENAGLEIIWQKFRGL